MEAYYILIVAVLFLLAISDLIVGVSNDAVNFLNSAIGSKAAPFKIILGIAAAGVQWDDGGGPERDLQPTVLRL